MTAKTRTQIMKNDEIYKIWSAFVTSDQYKIYFPLDFETNWRLNMFLFIECIKNTGNLPIGSKKDLKSKHFADWVKRQPHCTFEHHPHLKKIWDDFFNQDHVKCLFFITPEVEFKNKLNEFICFVDIYQCYPPPKTELYNWFMLAKRSKEKSGTRHTNPECKKLWDDFVNDKSYNHHVITFGNKDHWRNMRDKSYQFVKSNNIFPDSNYAKDKSKEIKTIAKWLENQKVRYRNKYGMMKNEDIRKEWVDFITKINKKNLINRQLKIE